MFAGPLRRKATEQWAHLRDPHTKLLRLSWEPSVAFSGSPEGVLGVLVLRVFHVIGRTGSLGVQSSLRHRSYWEPWRSKRSTSSFVMVRTGSLGVQSPSRHWASWGREPWRRNCVRHWAVCGPEASHHRP